jgi:uncharacterized membrane protein YdbT with pleckstrin-like domain
MSYVANNLLNGETVTFSTKLHWKLFIAPALLAIFIMLPLMYFALKSQSKLLVLVPLMLMPLAFLPAYLRRRTSEFAVTNKRVIMKVGVLSTRSYELLLAKVEGIAVTQHVLGKIFDYGDIVVTGSGGTQEPFADIENPFAFRRAVQSVTDSQIEPRRQVLSV